MEDRNNKSNTMLLTVIAIATLLVAVIGATFAYFTATVRNNESESRVLVTGALLTIDFEGQDDAVNSAENVIPTKKINDTYEPIVTKTFTLEGINSTDEGENKDPMLMPYKIFLVVNQNSFALKHRISDNNYETALTYMLINNATGTIPTGSIPSSTKYGNIGATSADLIAANVALPANSDEKQVAADALQTIEVYKDDDTKLADNTVGLLLGQGYFPAANNRTAVTHSYTLKIYFKETTLNQDLDKSKTFNGYVAISAGHADTQLTKTFSIYNCTETTAC